MQVFHIGDMMYAEAPDVRPGRILDLPISRLNSLRRAAFKDVIAHTMPREEHPNIVVNTHATFRWRHGLFSAFDFDQLQMLKPEMFICLVDNIEVVHHRLHQERQRQLFDAAQPRPLNGRQIYSRCFFAHVHL